MRQILIFLMSTLMAMSVTAETGKGRGLWACKTTNGNNVFVSWRMRATAQYHL